MNPSQKPLFSWIARVSCTHFPAWILGALILAALSVFLITRLEFQSDVLNLLPGKAPRTGAFVKFLKEFGSVDSLFIVLERKSGGEVESFGPFAEVFADRLMATGEFTEMLGRLDPEEKAGMARQFISKALLYLPEDGLKKVEARVSDKGIEEQVRSLKAKLSSFFPPPWTAYDPLDLLPLFREYFPLNPLGEGTDPSGYIISADRKMILFIAMPRGSAPDVDYDERLVQKIQAAEKSARDTFASRKDLPAAGLLNDLQVGLTGGFIHALEDSRMIRKELLLNFSVSLFGVLLLMVLAFRSGVSILYALFPLLISPLLTLGLFSPFLGRLSESTGAFSAIILGLSVDFIILLYSRFLEEKNLGEEVATALEKSLKGVGPGIFTGAVTTAAAYYALLISDFRGIRELGLLTGTGILVSLGCAFFLFPALAAWREGRRPSGRVAGALPASLFGLERLCTLSLRKPLMVILLCTAISLGLLAGAFRVKLNNDPKRLRPAGHPSVALEMRVQEEMGEGLETIFLLTENKRAEEALEAQGSWKRIFDGGLSSGLPIARYENLAAFIPPLSEQEKRLRWLETREKDAFDPDRVEKRLRETLPKAGLRVEPFEPGFEALREMLGNRALLTWDEVEASPLKKLGERLLKKQGDTFLSAAYLHIRPDFWLSPGAEEFLESLKRAVPGTRVTSPRLVQKELESLLTGEAWKILLLALGLVSLLIFFDFRSWTLTFFSLLPVVLASLWTLGLMGILKIDLNFMNLVVFTMVLGIGVDYGVHILHRGLQSNAGHLEAELPRVGKGVVLAALTTLVGFGSLALSLYPGLQSMGVVTLMGVGFSLLISLTLIPVLLKKWLQKRRPF